MDEYARKDYGYLIPITGYARLPYASIGNMVHWLQYSGYYIGYGNAELPYQRMDEDAREDGEHVDGHLYEQENEYHDLERGLR